MGIVKRMLGRELDGNEEFQAGVLERDIGEPLEGTNMSLWQSQIPFWWAENGLLPGQQMFIPGNGLLAERVWVANRCVQMNAQQIASMPLNYEAPNVSADGEPAWVSSPDPNYYPNGISDAIFSIVSHLYGWGFACLYVTNQYSNGYPRNWTVLPSQFVEVKIVDGVRQYWIGEEPLDRTRVVQIDRNPGYAAHGCSALRAYAQQCWGLLAAGNQSMSVSQGGIPTAVLKSQRKLTSAQAQDVQTQWMNAVQRRNGAPPVLPPELDFEPLSFNPQELGLLEVQDFNAKAIATAFGVPAVLLNMAIRWGMTYQNTASLGEMWWRYELRPTAKRIADALSAQMLPSGQYVWFDATDTYLPLSAATGPFATDENDPEAAGEPADPQADPTGAAKASKGLLSAVPSVTAIGGTRV